MSLDAILEAASELQDFCAARSWKFCFIGGIAVQRWGEPRFTADADITLLSGFGGEESFVAPLITAASPRLAPRARGRAQRPRAAGASACRTQSRRSRR